MNFNPDSLYHIYNRGNQQQKIFFTHENYLFFLKKMKVELSSFCEFIAYCLMPNHFHWLVQTSVPLISQTARTTDQSDIYSGLTNNFDNQIFIRRIANLLSSYSQAINKQNGTSGGLFQKKTKAKLIVSLDDVQPIISNGDVRLVSKISHSDFFSVFNYIHQNPWKAELVKRMEDWEFSSMSDYAGLRKGTLCNQKLGFEMLGIANRAEFMRVSYEVLDPVKVRRIF